jgi:hypothetical protein
MQLVDGGYLGERPQEGQAHRAAEQVLEGLRLPSGAHIGLLCTEVFTYDGLMVDKIERDMGIPLTDIKKFNVKGKVLIYKKDGEPGGDEAQDRPGVRAAGMPPLRRLLGRARRHLLRGVGAMDWTITILRTERGEASSTGWSRRACSRSDP